MRIPAPMDEEISARIVGAGAASRHDVAEAWSLLEDSHVLSQPWASAHVRIHLAMLRLGWRTRDRREVLGQLARLIVAAPGSWSKRYPVGNTGRARVPAMLSMPIRDDLRELLEAYR